MRRVSWRLLRPRRPSGTRGLAAQQDTNFFVHHFEQSRELMMPSSEGACVCVHVSGRRPEVSPVAFGLCSSVACRKGSFDQTRRINARETRWRALRLVRSHACARSRRPRQEGRVTREPTPSKMGRRRTVLLTAIIGCSLSGLRSFRKFTSRYRFGYYRFGSFRSLPVPPGPDLAC